MKSNFNLQAPSKKIFYLIGAVILFFLVIFGYKPLVQAYKDGAFSGSLSYNEGNQENSLDSDNDGLKDWQESLWKTDIDDQDTDNDGSTDGEEVAVGRDPTKPGPDDTIDSLAQVIALTNSATYLNDPNNLSQQLALQIFTNNISSDGTMEIDENSQTEIADNIVNNFQTQAIAPGYKLQDVKIMKTTDKASVKDFGTSVVILQDPLFNLSASASNPEILKTYEDLTSGLAKLEVPGEMADSYLDLLNNFYTLSQLYARIITEFDDPVKVYLDTKSFQDLTLKNRDIYKEFALYFKNNGIIWNIDEPGGVWNSY